MIEKLRMSAGLVSAGCGALLNGMAGIYAAQSFVIERKQKTQQL